jgi:hypothetical protein
MKKCKNRNEDVSQRECKIEEQSIQEKLEKFLLYFCVALILFTLFAPLLFTFPAICNLFNFSETGNIGNTIGGITAPFIGLVGAILIYVSFRKQVEANEKQIEANKQLKESNEALERNTEKTYNFELYKKIDEMLDTAVQKYENITSVNENDLFRKNDSKLKVDVIRYFINPKNAQLNYATIVLYKKFAYSVKLFDNAIGSYKFISERWNEDKFKNILKFKMRNYYDIYFITIYDTLKKHLSTLLDKELKELKEKQIDIQINPTIFIKFIDILSLDDQIEQEEMKNKLTTIEDYDKFCSILSPEKKEYYQQIAKGAAYNFITKNEPFLKMILSIQ